MQLVVDGGPSGHPIARASGVTGSMGGGVKGGDIERQFCLLASRDDMIEGLGLTIGEMQAVARRQFVGSVSSQFSF
jgi:hypothetical protein